MARYRVEMLLVLLVLLVGALLLVSAQGWEQVDGSETLNMYGTGAWAQTEVFSTPDHSDSDEDEEIPEDEFSEVAGTATSDNSNPFTDHGVQLNTADSGPRQWSSSNGGFHVEYVDTPETNWDIVKEEDGDRWESVDAPPRSWTSSGGTSGLDVVCSENGFQITLPDGPIDEVRVLGSKELLYVTDAPASCGYEVNRFSNTLNVPFTGCHVKRMDGYSLQLLYVESGQTKATTVSCEENLDLSPFPRAPGKSKPASKCSKPTTPTKAQNCAVSSGEQVPCGTSGMSYADCEKMGCCVDASRSTCYYPMDECTGDQHFVFAIRHDSASIPVDTTKLVIPGSPNCKPVIVNDKVAIFKFKVTECGVREVVVGEAKVYLAEVQTIVKALNLKYGVITRSDPLRFTIECRYGKSGASSQSYASIGYMVKTPTPVLPSKVLSMGLYGVTLRIAKDSTYSSYLPLNNQPLKLLLGKPVYLELRLKSPKPDAVILVNYCIAYPLSAKNALVLVYEGCANPNDPNVAILKVGDSKNRYQRRFVVKAFQFMDQKTNKYLDEEIYFMCSTEVCRPTEKSCEERCFDGKAP